MATNPRVAAYEASKKKTVPSPAPTGKATPFPKQTAKAKTPAKPKRVSGAEKLLQQYLKQGMSLNKARKKVSAETGIWPNGYTN
jgi:hypothetical protein